VVGSWAVWGHSAQPGAQAVARRRRVRIEWSPRAVSTASRFLEDTSGMAAVVAAVDALAADPYPAECFRWGDMLRLRVGAYRIMYVVEGDLITIERVDRVSDR
jgi:mRNA-degrading endonuclease RelE of RelBE toxin-antitoxin system